MRKEEYLNTIYQNIKYRGIWHEIKNELSVHIDEAAQFYEDEGMSAESAVIRAVADMGKPEDIATKLNKQYRMPFNSRYGLTLWSAAAVAFVYFILYPFISLINKDPTIAAHEGITTYALLVLFAAVNYIILRRGHFKINIIDLRDIALGFIIGAVISCVVLFLLSQYRKYGYYFYFPTIKIMFFNTLNLYGGETRSFFFECLTLLFCVMIYLISCPIKKKQNSYLVQQIQKQCIHQ